MINDPLRLHGEDRDFRESESAGDGDSTAVETKRVRRRAPVCFGIPAKKKKYGPGKEVHRRRRRYRRRPPSVTRRFARL